MIWIYSMKSASCVRFLAFFRSIPELKALSSEYAFHYYFIYYLGIYLFIYLFIYFICLFILFILFIHYYFDYSNYCSHSLDSTCLFPTQILNSCCEMIQPLRIRVKVVESILAAIKCSMHYFQRWSVLQFIDYI
jgi:uncharacterized membrane protein YesL